jgi:internalin A
MFLKILRLTQEQQEVRCPSIFSVVRGKSGRIGGTTFELRLYCEEPGSWHPLPEPAGCYQIHEPTEWLQKIGPHLHQLLTVLKHAAPLAGPVLGMAVGTVSERVASEIDAMTELINQIPEPARKLASPGKKHDSLSIPGARAVTEADFRALESLLNKIDPDRIWGGLSRMTTPEGLTLYLCREHYESYRRTIRLSYKEQ